MYFSKLFYVNLNYKRNLFIFTNFNLGVTAFVEISSLVSTADFTTLSDQKYFNWHSSGFYNFVVVPYYLKIL